MLRLTLLGTGTPAPSLRRQSSGHLVEIGTDVILLDHGPGAHQRLIESGRSATQVTQAFFTHLHYDHCLDYARLVLQRWDMGAGKVPELEVFGPAPIGRMTELLFSDDGVFGPDIAARTRHPASLEIFKVRGGVLPRKAPAPRVRELAPGDVVETERWRLSVGEAHHVQPYLVSLAYRIDTAEGSVCYAGDSGTVFEPIVSLAKGADVLIHMMHYRKGTEPNEAYGNASGSHIDVAHVARRAEVGTLVLTHMIPALDRPGVREAVIAEMSAIFPGRLVWGEDLMEIPIGADGHAPID